MLWLTIGALLYKKPTKMLSFSAAECVGLNSSSLNVSNIHEIISPYNGTIKETISDTSSINSLYQISYTLYVIIGPVLCILLAVLVSCITGIYIYIY
ncbi:hypothetical protein Avbf_15554, partial [Armadillidium vulgare]